MTLDLLSRVNSQKRRARRLQNWKTVTQKLALSDANTYQQILHIEQKIEPT